MKQALLLIVLFVNVIVVQASTTPTGWVFAGKYYKLYIDKAAGKNGKNVPTIKSAKNIKDEDESAYFMQECIAEKYKGKRVRMSGYMKSENVKGWAGFLFRADRDLTTTYSFDNMMDRKIKGTNDWTKYDIVLDIPDSVNRLAYGAILNGNGQIWLDNISFEIVDKTVPVTSTDNLYGNAYIWRWHGPVNLDFDGLEKIKPSYPEVAMDSAGLKQGWIALDTSSSGYHVDIDKGKGLNGSNAATIKCLNVKGKRQGGLSQFFLSGKYCGKHMRMTAYMRSENVSKWAGFWVYIYGKSGTMKPAVSNTYSKNEFKGTKDWTKCEIDFDVPLDSYSAMIGVLLNGNGQVWVDNISFEIIGDISDARIGKDYTQKEPTNLDFSK